MDIFSATQSFEHWIAAQTPLVRGDIRHKHAEMRADVFSFLRATYYRWVQRFAELDAEITGASRVLAVGDLHLENFGTWRDALGRVAWGINDFDEAYVLPYTHDLVRLAASALIAIGEDHLRLKPKSACQAIVAGYRQAISEGGRPFVIGEEHRWFEPILRSPLRDPGLFWDKLRALPRERMPLPPEARALIVEMLPDARLPFELRHHQAGLGNLGKPRFTAVSQWQGGAIVREVKALTLSAAAWAAGRKSGPFYAAILARAVRAADPFLKVKGSWIARRLAPDSRRIELDSLSRVKEQEWLLHAMGYEIANVHLGTRGCRARIQRRLGSLGKSTLRAAAEAMVATVEKDFRAWRRG